MTEEQTKRRLYKSRTNRMIAGVCGGVAEYFTIDPTIVRLFWFLSIFLGGTGLILYLAAMIIMPTNPSHEPGGTVKNTSRYFWGLLLIGLGAVLLFHNLDIVPFYLWWGGFSWWESSEGVHSDIPSGKVVMALLFIAVGAILVLSYFQKRSRSTPAEMTSEEHEPQTVQRKLYRSLSDRKLFGVCGGIGEYFDIDPTIVRLLFVFITLYSFGVGILAYLILAIIVPEERLRTTSA